MKGNCCLYLGIFGSYFLVFDVQEDAADDDVRHDDDGDSDN